MDLLCLLEQRHLSSLVLRHQHSWYWVFRIRLGLTLSTFYSQSSDLDWSTPQACLALQLADSRSWVFPASKATWASSYNKSPFVYRTYWFCSLENSNTLISIFLLSTYLSCLFLCCFFLCLVIFSQWMVYWKIVWRNNLNSKMIIFFPREYFSFASVRCLMFGDTSSPWAS